MGDDSVRPAPEHLFVSTLRGQISSLLDEGLSVTEIATRLGCAKNTVRYHRKRLATAAPQRGVVALSPLDGTHVRHVPTRDAVGALLAEGISGAEIARRLGLSPQTVSYHARRLGRPVDRRATRRYDWSAVQAFYDAGHTVRECMARFGFSSQSWHAAVKRGAIVARPTSMPISELCVAGTNRNRHYLKRRLITGGLKTNECELCGISEWNGAPLSLALHHVNGNGRDNRVENLQLLCPNCHSQTENYGSRNRRRAA